MGAFSRPGNRVGPAAAWRMPGRAARLARDGLRALVALAVAGAFLFPLYFTLTTSLDRPADVFRLPVHLTLDWQWQVYAHAWAMAQWPVYFRNTAIIAACTISLAFCTSILAAYAFSFLEFRGRDLVFSLFLVVLMVPGEALLIPNYVTLDRLHLLDTLWAQILPYGTSVYGVFLLRQFFLTLPKDLWEAARLEGAGHLRFLRYVALPLARPVLLTVGLYIFIGCWNSLLWPLIVTTSKSVQPIEVAVATFLGAHSVDWRRLSAVAVFTTWPVVVVFLLLNRYILAGISRSDGING